MKRIALLLAGCMAIASTPALAAPFFVTWTDTLSSSSTAPYNVGENVVIVVRFDNGGNTTESQTWDSSDILTIRYLFNDDPNTITTEFNPAAIDVFTMSGVFQTDASGQLVQVPTGIFGSTTAGAGVVSDDPTGDQAFRFWVNGGNEVLVNDTGSPIANAAFADNVDTNLDPDAWVVGGFAPPEPAADVPVPSLSQWSLMLLAALALMMGLSRVRGRHQV